MVPRIVLSTCTVMEFIWESVDRGLDVSRPGEIDSDATILQVYGFGCFCY